MPPATLNRGEPSHAVPPGAGFHTSGNSRVKAVRLGMGGNGSPAGRFLVTLSCRWTPLHHFGSTKHGDLLRTYIFPPDLGADGHWAGGATSARWLPVHSRLISSMPAVSGNRR